MRFVALVVALFATAAWAQPSKPSYLTDEFEDKPWEEQKAQLPPYPKPENLVRINVSAVTSFDFFVDRASVSVDKDEVIRYTLVARSADGATNVSFEGIRCATRERKLYAFGSTGNNWMQSRNAEWAKIREATANRQHAALADDYFCPGRLAVRNTEEALDALKRGGHPGSR